MTAHSVSDVCDPFAVASRNQGQENTMVMLYDIFTVHPETGEILPGGGADFAVPLYFTPTALNDVQMARNVNGDGHVLYGYLGSWRTNPPTEIQDFENKKAARVRAANDRRALADAGILSMERQGRDVKVRMKTRTTVITESDCVWAALQDDPDQPSAYRAIARKFGWLK